MAKPTGPAIKTKFSTQEMGNRSWDNTFDINTIEMVGYDGTNLQRLGLNTDGSLKLGFAIPSHNYIALTYVAAGNGEGEVETVVYKTGGSGGTTVATLTLAYNASHEVSSVTQS